MEPAPSHARRHTVTVAELRRVLANAPPPRPSLDSAFAPRSRTSSPTSPTTSSPSTSPSSSPITSASHSPLVTPSAAPGCSDSRSLPRAFDVRVASEVCRRIDGYVSFMDVEGLGAPPGVDDDEMAEARAKGDRASWSSWFGFAPPVPPTAAPRPTPSPTRAPSKRY